jgi:hypothetical protein
VAVWADAGEGFSLGHQVLMDEFYDAIFDNKYALGKAAKQAKINTYAQNSAWAEMVETFSLFGDPAMQLGGPAQETGSGPVFLPIVIKND